MFFRKGSIITYTFPPRPTEHIDNSKVIRNYHRAVVLHKRKTPFKTVLIAPITKAISLKQRKEIPSNYVELKKENYPLVLVEDSFINLDMTMPVDEVELQNLTRGITKIDASLNEEDLNQLNYKITLTYELSNYIRHELNHELNREFNNVITLIDRVIKPEIEDILLTKKDKDSLIEVEKILDFLIDEIKLNYIKNQT
ncbi:hypothetical protein ACFFJF_11470 [Allobacillus sp. GCM10007489]|uniref:type II toxin-antitoxin system PemK/MazF family toxin n=1 Tax=unclassified Allobacillus TaxID=2628859 RepID=UPI001642C76E|nr:type II toxin-antitoxin system PemK/MazF family toxin [Allobacillus sp. SKP2-8]